MYLTIEETIHFDGKLCDIFVPSHLSCNNIFLVFVAKKAVVVYFLYIRMFVVFYFL